MSFLLGTNPIFHGYVSFFGRVVIPVIPIKGFQLNIICKHHTLDSWVGSILQLRIGRFFMVPAEYTSQVVIAGFCPSTVSTVGNILVEGYGGIPETETMVPIPHSKWQYQPTLRIFFQQHSFSTPSHRTSLHLHRWPHWINGRRFLMFRHQTSKSYQIKSSWS